MQLRHCAYKYELLKEQNNVMRAKAHCWGMQKHKNAGHGGAWTPMQGAFYCTENMVSQKDEGKHFCLLFICHS